MANSIASSVPAANPQESNASAYTTSCITCAAYSRQRLIDDSELNVSRVNSRRKAFKFKTRSITSLGFSSTVTRSCKLRLLERRVDRSTRTNCISKLLEERDEVQKELTGDRTDACQFTFVPSKVPTSDRLYPQNESQLRGKMQAGSFKFSATQKRREETHQDVCMSGRRELLLGTAISGLTAVLSFRSRRSLATTNDAATETKEEVTPSQVVEPEENYRIYDASVLGEPEALGKDKGRVWQKLLAARVVYLGEAESVPDPDDKVLELEIVQTLRDKCFEQQRPVSVAMEAFPCTLQKQLNMYMSKRLSDDELRGLVPHWPDERWQEYQPLLQFCRSNGVRLMAGGAPPEVLRTVQARGVQGLSDADKRKYAPPMGGGFGLNAASTSQLYLADVLPNASAPFGPGPYRFAQARMVEDHTMSQVVVQAMADGGSVGLLIVILGATHVLFGSRGSGLPARIAKNLQKRTQAVVLLNPERQRIRKEGELPEADFLWYSAAKPCIRNCFDRAEVARVMDAAGRRREALPKDLQTGIDLGLISPEVLKDFFDLDKQPFIAELTQRFQGFRERWLADPAFFNRLFFEEAISITTTLMAQYERRKGRFLKELDYVITDTVRGAVVDFFTVWLPAPTLSFHSYDMQSHTSGTLEGLKGFFGSLPDNAFQRATGVPWDLRARILAVLIGGLKLFSVGFVASIGTVTVTNTVQGARQYLRKTAEKKQNKKSPILKTALVYSCFLGTSANLRYQAIAGIVEHWIADYYLSSQPVAGYFLSFLARTANSFWGTQQWVDLARLTGLQASHDELPEVEFKAKAVSGTIEAHSSTPEIPVDQTNSKPTSWKASMIECITGQEDLARLTGLQASHDELPARAEEVEFKAKAVSGTIEGHSSTPEIPADQINSKPTSWEASMIECITAQAVQDEQFDEKETDSVSGHGN